MKPTARAFRYLLVTHIPFARREHSVVVDGLWARDLDGLVASVGPIRVAAPEYPGEGLTTWGPSAAELGDESGVEFVGLKPLQSRRHLHRRITNRAILSREVRGADLVHTHNLFPPYTHLAHAHDLAVRQGKKTLFVIAEDFYDMLDWEWVRSARSSFDRARRQRALERFHRRTQRSASTADLTFLHTPAAVLRYRARTRNGVAIRQPGHESEDVIGADELESQGAALLRGAPLQIVTACRHKDLKGLDFLIRAVARLAERNVRVEMRLYGSGAQTSELKTLSSDLGTSDRVSFPGTLEAGREVYQAIASAHIFAMPHRTTDFGRAFYDAMAGGSPVLAFRTPASVGTVRDGIDGILAPLDDVEGLAMEIERLHRDRTLLVRMAQAARQRALVETRSAWFEIRARFIREILATLDSAKAAGKRSDPVQ